MPARRPRVLVALIAVAAVLVALAACGGPKEGTVEGLVTAASERTLTVQPADGGSPQTFVNGDERFPASHLQEHITRRLPVRVRWELRDGRKVAVRIDDA